MKKIVILSFVLFAISAWAIEGISKYYAEIKYEYETVSLENASNYGIIYFNEPYISINSKYVPGSSVRGEAMIFNDEPSIMNGEGYYIDFWSTNIQKLSEFCYMKDSLAIYKIKNRWAKRGFNIIFEYNSFYKPYRMGPEDFEGYESQYVVKVIPWRLFLKCAWIGLFSLDFKENINSVFLFNKSKPSTKYSYPLPETVIFDHIWDYQRYGFPCRFIKGKDKGKRYPILLPDDYYNSEDCTSFPPIRVESGTDDFTETGINVHGYDVYEDPSFDINDYQLKLTRSEGNRLEYVGTLVKRQNR